MGYEIIEHTADIGVKVNARTLKELFQNAARGMFEIIAGKEILEKNKSEIRRDIRIKKDIKDFEELLVDWLSELLYIFNKEEIVFNKFKVLQLDNSGIASEASGKKIDPAQNPLKTEIKAVTFHGLKIKEDKNSFNCSIIFDV